MTAIARLLVLALCAGQAGLAAQCAAQPARATGATSAQSATSGAAIGPTGARALVVRGKVFDLDAPLPVAPRTLPDGHPLLRETALADDSRECGGRLAPAFDTPARRAIHERIVADAVVGVTPQSAPVLFVMAGGSGSGKGFVRARLEATGEIPTRNRVLIDPDEILVRLPEWQRFKEAGDGRAATILHEESSLLAKCTRALAAARRLDVVLDVTLADAGSARAMFAQFRRAGYAIRLFVVATDAQVSAAQAADRARQSSRWVPWSVMLEAHRDIAAEFEGYARLVDRVSLFENSGEQPTLMAERDAGGGLNILDPPAYRRWLERSRRINTAARTLGEVYGRTPQ